ncbi:MAG: sugar transferase [Flavobacteriia bacterium]|nr:sugar transferase [Flavobacteriia bacterium]
MKKNTRKQVALYLLFDAISALTAYSALYTFRKEYIEPEVFSVSHLEWDNMFFYGLISTTLYWLLIYILLGFYKDIWRRSRLKEIFQTLGSNVLGSIVIFFALILNDFVENYQQYYELFGVYLGALFVPTVTFRFILSTRTNRRIQARKIWFNTLLVGSNEKAVKLYNEIRKQRNTTGHHFVGFVSVRERIEFLVEKDLPLLGNYKELTRIIDEHEVEEVLIAIESKEHEKLEAIINLLEDHDVRVKSIPDTYDIIVGKVRLESYGIPLIEVKHEIMPLWQRIAKRAFDILVSLLLLIIFSPIMLFTAIMVRQSSKGPIFYRQQRIGLHGHPFHIIKFRSMYQDAEKHGPQLSSDEDDRITPWGKVMRKYRLDELPQFLNVLIGEMSIVGPRPERQYYIDKIKSKAPHYKHVHKVKPGITSWGMVKFGYASTVDEMIDRLKFDLIYIENVSFFNDLKILFYTILIVLQGRGK